MNKKIILASASPRRKELLAQIGLSFTVIPSQAEEETKRKEPSEMVKELSERKASDIWETLPEREKEAALVIGADTVVSLDGTVMGKPKSRENAKQMLASLQGRAHQVYTGVTLIWQEKAEGEIKQKKESFFEETSVEIYPMTTEEIEDYIATGEPMDKAGAYGIQGSFAAYVKGIAGDYNNVVGLPVGRIHQEMKKIHE